MTAESAAKLREYGQAWLDAQEAQQVANEKRHVARSLVDHPLRESVRQATPDPSIVMDDGIVLTFHYTGNRDSAIEVSKTTLLEVPDAAS